ncbi:hypothetical protein FD28_GL001733 [Levilactobacillus hammesii DSM 16381]|uniref:Uncharacterized protein n=1 Tax=Levilactobacillus hammesii DSM 16381 TaxID=1423753 RepID=A0A0R1UX73_9LACO|nr:hypothetical protein FD28_GL001733 [Levilactobacillus hammesii DSM 16381]
MGRNAVGRTEEALRAVFFLALSRKVHVSKSPFSKPERLENPTAEPKFGFTSGYGSVTI